MSLFLVFMSIGTTIALFHILSSTDPEEIRGYRTRELMQSQSSDLNALSLAVLTTLATLNATTSGVSPPNPTAQMPPPHPDAKLPEAVSVRAQISAMRTKIKEATQQLTEQYEREATYAVNTADKLMYQLRNFEPLQHSMGNPQWNPGPYKGSQGLNFVIGISSIARERDYVADTLRSIMSAMSPSEKHSVKIIIMNGNVPPGAHAALKEVAQTYRAEIKEGLIKIITNPDPVKGHLQLVDRSKLTLRWQDSVDRVLWRSKQVLDVAFLLEECSKVATPESYFLMIEDDVIAANNFVTKIRTFMDEKLAPRTDWITASFYNPWTVEDLEELPPYKFFGVIGQVFRPHDLPTIVEFLRKNFDQSPLDWLFVDFLKKFDGKVVVHTPSMFQHVGEVSSLKGKTQPSRAVDFEDEEMRS